MRKILKIVNAYVGIAIMCLAVCGCQSNKKTDTKEMSLQTANSIQQLGIKSKILNSEEIFPAGNSYSDWIAMTLAFAGVEDAYDDYLNRLKEYVVYKYETEGHLHRIKATEYHRITLTMLALGGDPSKIENNGKEINLIADGTYQFHAGSPGLQGSNGLIYALLTLDSMDYQVPAQFSFDRESIITELLEYQQQDGGFALDESIGGSIDITAMALQALAPYREIEKVSISIEKALLWLSENMTENGTFLYSGDENAESCAQVVLALCALGIDPAKSEMFEKSKNVLDGMNSFRLEDGMYQHVKENEQPDLMATYQALHALEAVEKLRTESRWIFDFQDYQAP